MTDANVNRGEEGCSTSLSLLERIKAQDRAAWDRMVSLYTPLVYRWSRQVGLQAADAEDVGQEVFQAVARKIADFRRDQEGQTFRGWLRIIWRNKLRDFFRRKRAQLAKASETEARQRLLAKQSAAAEEVDPSSEAEERKILYRRAVEFLRKEFEERTWQAFWRVAVEERQPREVAAELGMTPNAVYLAKSRVLRRLREEFAGLLEENLL